MNNQFSFDERFELLRNAAFASNKIMQIMSSLTKYVEFSLTVEFGE